MDSPENNKSEPQPVAPSSETAGAKEAPAPAPAPKGWGDWLVENRIGLTLMIAVIAFAASTWGLEGLVSGAIVLVGLSFIIFIHELGHFAVAKWCDVHVETFSIGFGPPLPGCSFQRGETTYMIAMVPLGGYVKMVGENPENDEDDNDPRSFKNKRVWQRMAIISAGVIMNLIFGCIAFITVFMLHGDESQACIVGQVEAGGAAWVKDLQPGDVITKIGDKKNPNFGDLLMAVILSDADEPVDLDYVRYVPSSEGFRSESFDKFIVPIRTEQEGRPMVGMHGPVVTQLVDRKHVDSKTIKMPVYPPTAAAGRAEPPFEFGDLIVASSFDPRDPKQVKDLPIDPRPRKDGKQRPDYYELRRRMIDLAGQEMIVRVERTRPDAKPELIDIKVPPQFYYDLGLRMQMGQVAAVQEGSPAAKAGVRARDAEKAIEGDRITEVEVPDGKGGKLRWMLALPDKAPEGVRILDPMRLPFELTAWAATVPAEQRKVGLTLKRENKHAEVERVTLTWNDEARYARPSMRGLLAPVAIPELGLAYHVETTVAGVAPGSPASQATKLEGGEPMPLRPDDVVLAYWFYKTKEGGSEPVKEKVNELRQVTKLLFFTLRDETVREAWPSIFSRLQDQEVKKLGLRIERGGETHEVVLEARPDEKWARADRGLFFQPDTTLTRAENIGQAMAMGFDRTRTFVQSIYVQLQRLVSNRISFHMHATGPIGIFDRALDYSSDWYKLLLFLGLISVNLAVVNFLPIPVLDGGHMVFLIYEAIRGKPAPEWIRLATTYAGLVLILSLMLYVIYLDVARLFL